MGCSLSFWALLRRLDIHLHIEWVKSDLNISEPVSRRDFSIAHRLGWKNLEYASQQAVQDCLSLPLDLSELQFLVQDGKGVPVAAYIEGTL